VTSGGARRGRRDNGLVAAAYAAAGDVDPRVGEHLLDVLAVRGIAAYLQPASDLHPVTRTTTLPARPTDRLFVDREHQGTARDYLTRLRDDEASADTAHGATGSISSIGPVSRLDQPASPRTGPADGADAADSADLEAAFAEIVAGFDSEPESPTGAWPAAEDLDTARPEPGRRPLWRRTEHPGGDYPRLGRPAADEPSLLDGLDTFGADLPDDDEGYTPPPAPPLPRPSRAAVLAILAIGAGLAFFFFPGLLPVSFDMSLLLGFAGLLTGFVILIWRLRPGNEDEDDSDDDGAVV
jgi:hypothetical protein